MRAALDDSAVVRQRFRDSLVLVDDAENPLAQLVAQDLDHILAQLACHVDLVDDQCVAEEVGAALAVGTDQVVHQRQGGIRGRIRQRHYQADVRARQCLAHVRRRAGRRVDDDDVVFGQPERVQVGAQPVRMRGQVLLEGGAIGLVEAAERHYQCAPARPDAFQPALAGECGAGMAGDVLHRHAEVQAQRVLRVEVDGEDTIAGLRQRIGKRGRQRGFPNSALGGDNGYDFHGRMLSCASGDRGRNGGPAYVQAALRVQPGLRAARTPGPAAWRRRVLARRPLPGHLTRQSVARPEMAWSQPAGARLSGGAPGPVQWLAQ
ncbi:hypothetical protein D3C81_1374430 [compost metagenome]